MPGDIRRLVDIQREIRANRNLARDINRKVTSAASRIRFGPIEFEVSNKLRGDSNGLRNTVSDWNKAPGHFHSLVKKLNKYVVNTIDAAIVAGAAENNAQNQFFTGQASPWTPDASAIRAVVGAGQSDSTWYKDASAGFHPGGVEFTTVFTKNNIIMARESCEAGGGTPKEFSEKYGGKITSKIREAMNKMYKNRYNNILDETMFSHKSLVSSKMAKIEPQSSKGIPTSVFYKKL